MRKSAREHRTLPASLWRLKPIQWLILDLNDWLFPLMAINMLWVLLSITLVLLPPATAALFDLAYESYRGIAPAPRTYLAHMRRRFWKSWAWALANLIVFGALVVLGRAASGSEIALAVLGIVGALCIMAQFYFWAYVVLQEQPELLRALRNSVFTALGGLFYIALYLAITLAILIPSLILIAPILLITPVLLTMLCLNSLIGWLQHHKILNAEAREL